MLGDNCLSRQHRLKFHQAITAMDRIRGEQAQRLAYLNRARLLKAFAVF